MPVKEIVQQKVVVLATYRTGVPFEDALRLVGNRRILSNEEVDKLLASNEREKVEKVRAAFPCWTGTMAAYVKPGKKLRKEVEYTDPETKQVWVFPVPQNYQGKKNVAISVNHPHFTIKVDGNKRTVIVDDEVNVSLTTNLPAKDGWYAMDANGIPCGEKLDSDSKDARYNGWYATDANEIPCREKLDSDSKDARRLLRADKMVSPVARGFDGFGGRGVDLAGVPSERLGVVAEEKSAGEAVTPEKRNDITQIIRKQNQE